MPGSDPFGFAGILSTESLSAPVLIHRS
jgi:hypothetical protein